MNSMLSLTTPNPSPNCRFQSHNCATILTLKPPCTLAIPQHPPTSSPMSFTLIPPRASPCSIASLVIAFAHCVCPVTAISLPTRPSRPFATSPFAASRATPLTASNSTLSLPALGSTHSHMHKVIVWGSKSETFTSSLSPTAQDVAFGSWFSWAAPGLPPLSLHLACAISRCSSTLHFHS